MPNQKHINQHSCVLAPEYTEQCGQGTYRRGTQSLVLEHGVLVHALMFMPVSSEASRAAVETLFVTAMLYAVAALNDRRSAGMNGAYMSSAAHST